MWWLMLGVLLAVAVITVVINGIIDNSCIENVMYENKMKSAIIEQVDRCNNKVTLRSLYSDKTVEIKGNGVSRHLEKGDNINI